MTTETIPEENQKYKRGQHPNSRASLKPGYHGQDLSHNGVSLTTVLKTKLHRTKALQEKLVDSAIEGALLREPTPFKEIWDRVDGKLESLAPSLTLNINAEKVLIDARERLTAKLSHAAEVLRITEGEPAVQTEDKRKDI